MDNYALEQASVVLLTPSGEMRATLRDALYTIGFRRVMDTSDLERVRQSVTETNVDLLLLDLDHQKDEICELVRGIRHGRSGPDPFMVILALTWSPRVESVNVTMETGVDDIVSMPVSVKMLADRIDALIRSRKNFVVTSSYVGPDRRTKNRPNSTDELGAIQVPNNLRFKAVGDVAAAALPNAVAKVQAEVQHHRLNRYAQRIHWLTEQAEADKPSGDPDVERQRLNEIDHLIGALADDLKAKGLVDLLNICGSMDRVLGRLRSGSSHTLYELMRLHALAVTATLMDREGAAELIVVALNDATDVIGQRAKK